MAKFPQVFQISAAICDMESVLFNCMTEKILNGERQYSV